MFNQINYTSTDELTPFNIIFSSPDDGSFKPKCYNVDFLLH